MVLDWGIKQKEVPVKQAEKDCGKEKLYSESLNSGGQDSQDALNFKRHAIILMAICQWWNAFSFFSFRAFWGSIKRQPYVWMAIAAALISNALYDVIATIYLVNVSKE